jgi:formate hydrogenlyase subunit 3/multisubunit Na+/H+ antiporter MnhD subunit
MFWLLLLAAWGSLNLVFLSGDLFTLYVGMELLTFVGVPLLCLDGRGETLRAGLRYLLFALLGSLLYLLGVVLVHGAWGTIDIALLRGLVQPGPVGAVALGLMTAGLLAKTALFPLHLWLPPAHGAALPAASAVHAALVVKGSWFLAVRLWFDAFAGMTSPVAAQLLSGLGTAAIVVGSIVALRQHRLKFLIAYSTIAQIGYLFLIFPLAFDAGGAPAADLAKTAGFLQAAAHATAKAGMFMAAGLLYAAFGHDRIADLGGAARAMPVTVAAACIAGVALMGVLPGGGYLAKKLLLGAAAENGLGWLIWVLHGGAAFTAGYVVLVLANALKAPAQPLVLKPVSRAAELVALGLASASLLLGLIAIGPRIPSGLVSSPLALKELGPTLLIVATGGVLAFGLARRPPFGRADAGWRVPGQAVSRGLERIDHLLRRWPVATLSLVGLAGAFAALLRE